MTKPGFNTLGYTNEQKMYDSMVRESIAIKGMDMYYMPRKRIAFDKVYYEDSQSLFDSAYLIDVYCNLDKDFQGKGTFMSQLGMLEVRDQITFWISTTEFAECVTTYQPTILRPNESDLIFFPMNQRLFEVQYVSNKPFFYQIGELPLYTVTCELIEYSNERIETGIEEIDAIQMRNTTNILDHALKDESGNILTNDAGDVIYNESYDEQQAAVDPTRDNKNVRTEANTESLIVFNEANPYTNSSSGTF